MDWRTVEDSGRRAECALVLPGLDCKQLIATVRSVSAITRRNSVIQSKVSGVTSARNDARRDAATPPRSCGENLCDSAGLEIRYLHDA